ncbi:hypothetical protein FACS1894190_04230 [Spirochaetia bacterium]|nr:hypothetical protein FACS1894190_04230 [Spirochaetia bacterium]
MMLVFGLVLAACDNGNGPGGGGGKSFTLKGELKDLKLGTGLTPTEVLAYSNPDFKGAAVGKGTIGSSAPSASMFAVRSIGGVSRSIGEVIDYNNDNDTHWEIRFDNFNQNNSPDLYFAVAGTGQENSRFMYPLDNFEVPVNGINNGEDFDINTRLQNNNPFNEVIEIESFHFDGTVKVTGVTIPTVFGGP